MLTLQELLQEVDHLTAVDKWRLVNYVLDTLEKQQDSYPSQQPPASTNSEEYLQFIRETYSILSDTPINRWEQGEYEAREDLN